MVGARCRSEIIKLAALFVGGKISLQISHKPKPEEASKQRHVYLRGCDEETERGG